MESVHVPRDGRTPLVLVRKANGGKSDALNAGINVARYPLVAMVDADSLLDPDALLVVAKPFADDPLRTVATGGVVRAVNGSRVVAGRVVDVRMPGRWLPRIQVVEYLRAFLLGRTGWSRLQALVLISGAFGLYRRDVVVAVGGLHDTIGEDFELVMRIHRRMRDEKRDYRVTFVSEPVSWTEVPTTAEGARPPAAPLAPRALGGALDAPADGAQPALRTARAVRRPLLLGVRARGAGDRAAGDRAPRCSGCCSTWWTSSTPCCSCWSRTGTRCW